jgi:hypothetical protein
MTWSHQIKLTCGRRTKRLHPYPAFGGGAQEAETLLPVGLIDHRTYRFGSFDPSGPVRASRMGWRGAVSGGLHHRTFDDDASGEILPQGDEQFAEAC